MLILLLNHDHDAFVLVPQYLLFVNKKNYINIYIFLSVLQPHNYKVKTASLSLFVLICLIFDFLTFFFSF